MDFYEIVQKRHSVRNYEAYVLSEEEKTKIDELLTQVVSINEANTMNWIREEHPQSSGRICAKNGQTSKDYLIEYGFQGEQIILSLVEMNFDTLWRAVGTPSDIPAYLIFGKGKEKKSVSEKVMGFFVKSGNRKPVNEFLENNSETLNDSQMRIIQSCVKAPSAINRQPWKFNFSGEKELKIKVIGNSKLNRLDMGIVLFHAYKAFSVEFENVEIIKKGDFYWKIKA